MVDLESSPFGDLGLADLTEADFALPLTDAAPGAGMFVFDPAAALAATAAAGGGGGSDACYNSSGSSAANTPESASCSDSSPQQASFAGQLQQLQQFTVEVPPPVPLDPSLATYTASPVERPRKRTRVAHYTVPPPQTFVFNTQQAALSMQYIQLQPLQPLQALQTIQLLQPAQTLQLAQPVSPVSPVPPPPASQMQQPTPPAQAQPHSNAAPPAFMSEEELVHMSSNQIEAYIASVRTSGTLTPTMDRRLKKTRRAIKNREYAQQSRNKKKVLMDEIEKELNFSKSENTSLHAQVSALTTRNTQLENENQSLRDQVRQLQSKFADSSLHPAAPSGFFAGGTTAGQRSYRAPVSVTACLLVVVLFTVVLNFGGAPSWTTSTAPTSGSGVQVIVGVSPTMRTLKGALEDEAAPATALWQRLWPFAGGGGPGDCLCDPTALADYCAGLCECDCAATALPLAPRAPQQQCPLNVSEWACACDEHACT
eukprot:TRINITY_DN18457_c0_g1_i1.p1 TRINITY_DN18457_c0_g1~~TRINITY_DN18457_c0_g1_i1.p1  ORF type:complete len:484 (+),score=157.58 TRINITY_DN18457_c0_g1_i1:91-1542(+)